MIAFLTVTQGILSLCVVITILLQTPNATGLGGTIGGGDVSGGYRRRRGVESALLRATIIFIVLFVGVSVLITYFGNK